MASRGSGWVRRLLAGATVVMGMTTVMTACAQSSTRGWLASDGSRVIFAEWTEQKGGALAGNGRMLEVVPAVADPYALAEQQLRVGGVKRGAVLDLAVKTGVTETRWRGTVQ